MKKLLSVAIGLGLLVPPASALAHHAFAAEFDADKPLKMAGTVTKVEWRNPTRVVLHRREG